MMRAVFLLSLLLCALLASASSLGQDLVLKLNEDARPARHALTVREIAEVSADDPALRQLLQETTLLHLPGQGRPLLLTRARIEHLLGMRLPALKGKVVFAGAPAVLVHPPPPLAVRAGSVVTVEVRQGAVALLDRAISLDDGEPGKAVRVTNPRNQQHYKAVVLASGRVGVE